MQLGQVTKFLDLMHFSVDITRNQPHTPGTDMPLFKIVPWLRRTFLWFNIIDLRIHFLFPNYNFSYLKCNAFCFINTVISILLELLTDRNCQVFDSRPDLCSQSRAPMFNFIVYHSYIAWYWSRINLACCIASSFYRK